MTTDNLNRESGGSSVYEYVVNVPWGVVRIEVVDSGGDIPEINPMEAHVEAHETCIVAAVVHPDISSVIVRVTDEETSVEDECVFDGFLEVSKGLFEVADLVGDDFRYVFRVEAGTLRIKLFMDNPRESQRLTILVPSGVAESEA